MKKTIKKGAFEMLEELELEVIKQISEELRKDIKECKTDLSKTLNWLGKKYKGTHEQQEQKAIKFLEKRANKNIENNIKWISEVSKAQDFEHYSISIEWKKNPTWGANPTASDNYGNESGSISGCGYCKESTAFARLVNNSAIGIKPIYKYFNNELKKGRSLKEVKSDFPYGLNVYGNKPSLSGGVGVSCYYKIYETVGYKLDRSGSGKSFNCYIVTKRSV